jgi:DNA repair protein RecO (recombination protein O)
MPLREDLVLTSQAAYVLELLDRFTYEDEMENSAIFRLLTDTLARLASKADPWLVLRYYEMRLLDHLGFRPQLFECANCGARSAPKISTFHSAQAGSFVRAAGRDCAMCTRSRLKPSSICVISSAAATPKQRGHDLTWMCKKRPSP